MRHGQNTYGIGAITAAALALGILIFALPHEVRAFWPFSFARSAEAGTPQVLTDTSLSLLEAATNADPNPDKGKREIAMSTGSALIAEAGPEGTPDVATTPEVSTIATYTIEDGDTLSGIAAHFGVSVNTILWANDLTAKSTIRPGMELTILPVSGIQHTVKKGETLASLAKTYGGDVEEIATYNGLDTSAALITGSALIIPGGGIADAAPATTHIVSTSGTGVSTSVKSGSIGGLMRVGSSGVVDNGYYANPVPGGILTQGIHPTNGVDIGAPNGTPIYAAADGTVIVSKTGSWNGGYGNYVVISHPNGTQTLYAHQSRVAVSVGETVTRGEVIGYVGRSGNASGYHLHFEVRGAANPLRNCVIGTHCTAQ